MGLSTNLKKIRTQKNWSQNYLAKKAKVPQSTIHYIEKGERNPGLQTVQKLANALGISVSDLLEDKEKSAAV